MDKIEEIAGKLSEDAKLDLTVHWDEVCDADPLSNGRDYDAYLHDMEASGFIRLVPVDDDALEDAFAWERGIEPNGMMWELTPHGAQLKAYLERNGRP